MTKTELEIRNIMFRVCANDGPNIDRVFTVDEAKKLRRLAKRLHRQFEIQCNGCTERTANANILSETFQLWAHIDVTKAERAEAKCIAEIKQICDQFGLYFYIQSDPRGGTLYVSTKERLNDQNYDNGIFIA